MKLAPLVIFLIGVFVSEIRAEGVCHADVVTECNKAKLTNDDIAKLGNNCHAKYGLFSKHEREVESYIGDHIAASYAYLGLSSYYGNFMNNREGFKKYFRSLSDHAWDKALDLVKYVHKRGSHMANVTVNSESINNYVLNQGTTEFNGMSRTLDLHKHFAVQAHKLMKDDKDREFKSFLEEHFLHQHSAKIREIAGHVNDLKNFATSTADTRSLALSLFDDYLLKA